MRLLQPQTIEAPAGRGGAWITPSGGQRTLKAILRRYVEMSKPEYHNERSERAESYIRGQRAAKHEARLKACRTREQMEAVSSKVFGDPVLHKYRNPFGRWGKPCPGVMSSETKSCAPDPLSQRDYNRLAQGCGDSRYPGLSPPHANIYLEKVTSHGPASRPVSGPYGRLPPRPQPCHHFIGHFLRNLCRHLCRSVANPTDPSNRVPIIFLSESASGISFIAVSSVARLCAHPAGWSAPATPGRSPDRFSAMRG